MSAASFRAQPPAPGPVRDIRFPQVVEHHLENGVRVVLAQKPDLPLVTVRLVLDAGAATEPAARAGVAWLVAHALEAGTARRSADELAWELERLGTQLESWTTWDALHVQATVHAALLPQILTLLTEVIREAAFPEREVERLRDEQLAELLRRRTEPRALADDMAAHYIFARDTTYGRPLLGTTATVRTLDRAAAVRFHRERFTPGNLAIVMAGAFRTEDAVAHARAAWADWTGAAAAAPPVHVRPGPERTTVFLVDRPGAVQSELRLGHVGVPRSHPDVYALQVLNTIVGGAFTSRLNISLREKHGFTYGVRSFFAFRRGPGPFTIQTAVASDVTARAIAAALEEVRGLVEVGATELEVAAARDYMVGVLPLEMQTTEHLAARLADIVTFDLPLDYYEQYRARVSAVSVDDVARVARAHIHLDRIAIIVVGAKDAIAADIAELGIADIVHHVDDAGPAGASAA